MANGQKDRALVALRQRKYQESLLAKTDGQMATLEQLVRPILKPRVLFLIASKVSSIEFSLVEVSVIHGLKTGNEVLKEIHKELNVETVEKLLDETREAQAYQRVRCSSPTSC